MHELGIAQAIVDVVEDEARKAGAKKVVAITLSLGELSGIVERQLRFCFPFVTKDTALAEAELRIEHIAGEGFCQGCGETFALTTLFEACPRCGEFTRDIRAGQELKVASLEVE